MSVQRSVDDLLADARLRLDRLSPLEAFDAWRQGALLVDTRSLDQQRAQGVIPGAICHPASTLLWRLDGLSRETEVILVCSQGYWSSLAAAQLQDLGFHRATDVIDGVEGWRAAGLPLAPHA